MTEPGKVNIIKFAVRGRPIPKGSKKFIGRTKKGYGIVIDANKNTKPWQNLIKMIAADYAPSGGPWSGPVGMKLRFWMLKPAKIPKDRLGYPTTRPDSLKLARAVEDALSGIIYKDDSQVVDLHIEKRYGPVGVDVEVSRITANFY
ncbi:MAG: RusA family crossover junction endodeoxyribonuclease [Planctomycetota bacterium]